MKPAPITPRWLSYQQASGYSSLSISRLEVLVRKGLIASHNVRSPGSRRGRRLIDRESLDAFIEGSGSDASPLAINKTA